MQLSFGAFVLSDHPNNRKIEDSFSKFIKHLLKKVPSTEELLASMQSPTCCPMVLKIGTLAGSGAIIDIGCWNSFINSWGIFARAATTGGWLRAIGAFHVIFLRLRDLRFRILRLRVSPNSFCAVQSCRRTDSQLLQVEFEDWFVLNSIFSKQQSPWLGASFVPSKNS